MANNRPPALTCRQSLAPIPAALPGSEDAVDENYAMTPKQAIETVQAAGVDDPIKLIRDHAAAGRVRSYAQVQLVIEADGSRTSRLGATIAPEVWDRTPTRNMMSCRSW